MSKDMNEHNIKIKIEEDEFIYIEYFEAECKHKNWERGETIEPHYIYENGELVDEVNLYWVKCNECGAIGDEFVEGEGLIRIKWDAEYFEA